MSKRKSLDENNDKENTDPNEQISHKKIKAETLEEKFDNFIESSNEKLDKFIQNIQEKMLANLTTSANQQVSPASNATQNLSATIPFEAEQSLVDYQAAKETVSAEKSESDIKIDEIVSILTNCNEFGVHVNNGNLVKMPALPTLCVSYYDLVQITGFSKNSDIIRKLKDFILSSLKPDNLKILLNELTSNYRKISSPKLFIELMEHRRKWIEDYCRNVPQFSWKMLNPVFTQTQKCFPNVKAIKTFLQSDQTQMIYYCGVGINYARRFAYDHHGVKDGYSAKMLPNGIGSNAFVDITKTREFFDHHYMIYTGKSREYQAELTKLKEFIGLDIFF